MARPPVQLARMIGRTLGHYRILSALGAGGMGEVYRATDTRLGRDVALKVLPPAMASDPERLARFEREARAVAALNHPHIVTLHSVEEDDGITFLTMELVEGESLAASIPDDGLPIDRTLRIGKAIADALAAAHTRGIVHRDLKPGNVMVARDGRVKVLDFGLAKDLAAADEAGATMTAAAGHTEVGVVMGTPAYMSPEQVSGRAVDHRSDIFSFGVLLYEMASGQRPFAGGTSIELASAILKDTPRPLGDIRRDTPAALTGLIQSCLEKDRERRMQTARDVAAAIDTIAERPSSGSIAVVPSIAVLPFANMSADKDQDYFSDGLAEEIINLLAQVRGLKVIARTSAFAFRGKEQDIRTIARALDVTHVLEGSVRRAGDRIRVTAQLIAASDGAHLWSERFDRELRDIFEVQDDISAAITAALRLKLSSNAAPHRYQPKLPAYEAYLQARQHLAKVTPDSMAQARRYTETAIEIDPAFGLAHVGMGSYWICMAIFGRYSAHEAIPAARAAIARGLQCDPSLPEAHALLGYMAAWYDLDWAAAERHFEAPQAKQVGFSLERPVYGGFLFFAGRAEEAIAIADRAVAEDPLEVWPRMNRHAYLQAAGRDGEAYDETQRVLAIDERQVVALVSVAHLLADRGELARSVTAARRAHAVGPWYPDAVATLSGLLKRTGAEAEARVLFESLGASETCARAVYHLLAGEIDAGADWVEKAIGERDHSMLFYLRFVICRPLRASARWPKIARLAHMSERAF